MGPLQGIRILEFGSIGPGPFAAMVLADLGADIIRLQRAGATGPVSSARTADRRGRVEVDVNLKDPEDVALIKELVKEADAIIEGFRPGVMERLGLGPDELLAINPKLVYGRMTGYGQDGPLAKVPGHDINYISIAGTLGAIKRVDEKPLFPLNLLGDYGGGAMFLIVGVLAGVLEAQRSGEGQVVDVAMIDGVATLSTLFHGMARDGVWRAPAGTNILDSGAHFYEVYECSDGKYFSVGAIEPQFYTDLLQRIGFDEAEMPEWDMDQWAAFKEQMGALFKTKTRDEWTELLEPYDACATPVLDLKEAKEHPHNVARGAYTADGLPVAAPRFSRTPGDAEREVPSQEDALRAWGVSADALSALRDRSQVA
jgi:alpha-methylacyl-CoA racemase